ncbi:metallophosphoesterase MPPED2 [Aplysia californica]|uniref:Metallophosphoesterase MPPED2 n=1 Tax=Aplysia californica TaxID=6500 RepID=A0ABM0K2L4_APLCA|nr:metallophosphoesterase MPPED2 [Aplysia californica]
MDKAKTSPCKGASPGSTGDDLPDDPTHSAPKLMPKKKVKCLPKGLCSESAEDECVNSSGAGAHGVEGASHPQDGFATCCEGEEDIDEDFIEIDEDSSYPADAWERLKVKVPDLRDMKPDELIVEGDRKHFLRFVCMSDTHSRVEGSDFVHRVPHGDVLLHAGDFTMHSSIPELHAFNDFLGQLPHKLKIIIPGNHETSLDQRGHGFDKGHARREQGLPRGDNSSEISEELRYLRGILHRGILLQDSMIEFCGIKVYGCPWMPVYASDGFGLPRGYQLLQMYNLIPKGVDILLSHGPPLGIGDRTKRSHHAGCVELFNSVTRRIKPKYFVCGHIHEGYGIRSDGTTTYINAAVCNKNYRPVHAPVVFDFPLPAPITVNDFHRMKSKRIKVKTFSPLP